MQNGLCSFISDTNGLVLIIYSTSQCIGKCAARYFVKVMKFLKQQTTVHLSHPFGTVGSDHIGGKRAREVLFALFCLWYGNSCSHRLCDLGFLFHSRWLVELAHQVYELRALCWGFMQVFCLGKESCC